MKYMGARVEKQGELLPVFSSAPERRQGGASSHSHSGILIMINQISFYPDYLDEYNGSLFLK